MPDQDSQQRHPDSETKVKKDGVLRGRSQKSDPTFGSGNRAPSRQGKARQRLELAVDNGAVRTSLHDLVGGQSTIETRAPSPDQAINDAHAAIGRLFEAQEESARRIAQSLHDEASQMLAIVYLELENIARNSPQATAERIARVILHLDSVCAQIRGLSHELHPMVLERHGLVPALRQLASGVRKRSGLIVNVVAGDVELTPPIEVAIYRVAQEALANVVRHAGASEVVIRLWQADDRVHCSIRDDGVGYQPTDQDEEEGYGFGLGLVGIYERIDSLGGECHILSGDRKGMELSLGIPL